MLPLKTIPDVSNRKGHGHTLKPRAKPAPPKKRLRVGSVESTSGTKISTVEAQTAVSHKVHFSLFQFSIEKLQCLLEHLEP